MCAPANFPLTTLHILLNQNHFELTDVPYFCNEHTAMPMFFYKDICLLYHAESVDVKREAVKLSRKRWSQNEKNKTKQRISQQWKLKQLHPRSEPEKRNTKRKNGFRTSAT